ncbi:amidohydrolase family protein [archaeon]|nr:amidohydrolase family protein [archaeon]
MLIDCHTHIGGRSGIIAENQNAEELIEKMDTAGVNKAIVFPFCHNAMNYNFSNANNYIHECCKKYPQRFIGFGRLTPLSKTWKQEEKELRELGLKGVKIHTREYHLKKALQIFKETAKHSLPLIIHTDHRPHTHVKNIELLKDYPAPIIIGHAGTCYYHHAVRLVNKYEHMYIDTSLLSNYRLQRVIKEAGPDKLLFGSDSPYIYPLVAKTELETLELPKEVYEKITYKNFKSLFKGMRISLK